MSLFKRIEISLMIAVMTSFCFSMVSFAVVSDDIREDILRLHIIANSDSEKDQELKLKVRDALLAGGEEYFDGSINIDNAKEKLLPELNSLEQIAEDTIKASGFDYDVQITLKREYFTTRTYKDITLPAGKYLSLNVKIGEANGKNWWCVMFPPMCVSAADENTVLASVLNTNELNLVNRNPKYEPRFKFVELIESIKNRISS